MPIVELPAAEPEYEAADADAAEVLVQVAKVYLFLVVDAVPVIPKANMPTVPTAPPAFLPNPYPWADIAPSVIIDGILPSLKLSLSC